MTLSSKPLLKTNFISLGLRLTSRFIGLLSIVVILQKYGTNGIGFYSLVNKTLLWFVVFSLFGFEDYLLVKIKSPEAVKNVYKNVLFLGVISVVLSFLYLENQYIDDATGNLRAFLVSTSIVSTSLVQLKARVLKNHGQLNKAILYAEAIPSMALLISALISNSVDFILIIQTIVRAILALLIIRRKDFYFDRKVNFFILNKELYYNSTVLTSFTIKVMSNFRQLGVFLIFGIYLNLDKIGLASILIVILGVMSIPGTIIKDKYLPKMMHLQNSNSDENFVSMIAKKDLKLTACVVGLIILTFNIVQSFSIIQIPDYLRLNEILILGTGTLFISFVGPVRYYLLSNGQELRLIKLSIVSMILCLLFVVICLEFYSDSLSMSWFLLGLIILEITPLYAGYKWIE